MTNYNLQELKQWLITNHNSRKRIVAYMEHLGGLEKWFAEGQRIITESHDIKTVDGWKSGMRIVKQWMNEVDQREREDFNNDNCCLNYFGK